MMMSNTSTSLWNTVPEVNSSISLQVSRTKALGNKKHVNLWKNYLELLDTAMQMELYTGI